MTEQRPLVAVVGSLHYDITVDSPALPRRGETLSGTTWRPKLGGKGRNQAVAARRAGADVAMVGVVGNDPYGRALVDDLETRGINTRFLRADQSAATGMSVAIFEATGDYGAVIVSGANLKLAPRDIAAASTGLATAQVLMLQNEVPEPANLAAARLARKSGATVLLNAAPARLHSHDLEAAVDLLLVNATEAEVLGGIKEPETLAEAESAARALSARFRAVIVTVGAAGAAYASGSHSRSTAAIPVGLVSAHGAGDEYAGALAAEFARGSGIEAAMDAARRAAARLIATPNNERD